MLVGDAADDHGPPNVYAGLLQQVLSNVSNGQTGILALGVDPGSDAASWIISVSALLPEPQLVAYVNDETVGAITFSGYAVLYIPSPSNYTAGGISGLENSFLSARPGDVADFLTSGGGVFALTQGDLKDAYGWLGDFAAVGSIAVGPSGFCGEEDQYDDVSPSEAGELFGVTATNLDGCCWGNVFTEYPETLSPLAVADEPFCANLDGQAAILTGFVELPEVNFGDPDVTPAAGLPNVEAVGDLNGDDTVDVVAVIPDPDPQTPGTIQVFLNLGNDVDGQWLGLEPNEPILVGVNPSGVTTGLFNADANQDLAVTNANDGTVSILINDGTGDGAFTLTSTIATGTSPSAVVAANFNEDSFVDLAVTNEGDDNVVLLLGDGAGNFVLAGGGAGTGAGDFNVGDGPVTMLADDFDNNGDPDVAGPAGGFGGGDGIAQGGVGVVFVLLSNGDGTFQAVAEYPVGVNPRDIAISDLNGDTFLDIAAANTDDGTVSILINLGDGSFADAFEIQTGQNPLSVDAVDLNGDLDPDLAVVAEDLQIGASVQVFENRLEGGETLEFDDPVAFSVNADPNFVSNGDFNGDGLPDLVTVNEEEGGEGSVTVLLNEPLPLDCPGDLNGDGYVNVSDMLAVLASWGPCDGPCPADLNGDGFVDILDFLDLLFLWGVCPGEDACPWDLNGDGAVDGLDIIALLSNLGPCEDAECPWDLDGDGIVGLLDLWTLLLHLGDCG
jgi:hypothetical protein